jgi:PilZ domain-containing protein
MTKEKRRHYRINALNLLNYVCFDEEGNIIGQGMGRTLNVSESGILLETHVSLQHGCRITLTIGLEDDLIDIDGTVVFSKQGPEAPYEAGIEFFEKDGEPDLILSEFIKAFREERDA